MKIVKFFINHIKELGIIVGLLNSLSLLLLPSYKKRVLGHKFGKTYLWISNIFILICTYVFFTSIIIGIEIHRNGLVNLLDNGYGLFLFVFTIFLMVLSIIMEMIYQSKLRIAFTLFQV